MSDNKFEIPIEITVDKRGADEAKKSLSEISGATTDAGKADVAAQTAATDATKKTFTSKKELKDMVKQLGVEFPLLGSIGRMALNPIVAATAGVIAAFQIWKFRTDELTRSFQGLELSNFKTSELERMDKFAEKLKKIADSADEAKSKLNQLKQDIDKDAEFWKALGVDVGTGPAQAKAEATEAEATRLLGSAAAKRAAGVKPLSAADQAKLDADVANAEKDITERQSRLGQIEMTQGLAQFDPRRLFYDNQFRARYGNVSYDEARDIERGGIASSRQTLDFARNYKNRVALQAAGDSEAAAAQSIIEGNVGARQDIKTESAKKFKAAADAIDPSQLADLPEKMTAMFRALMEMNKAADMANREVEARRRVQSQNQ